MRQTTASIPPAAPDEAPAAEQGDRHAQDLRATGASQPPRAPSSPAEREQAELVDWLTRDLKPKHSLRPGRASAPPSVTLGGVEVPSGASSPPSGEARPSQAPSRAPGVAHTRAAGADAAGARRLRVALLVGVALLLGVAAIVRSNAPAAPVEGSPAPAAR